MRLYVAGPMAGISEHNFPAFHAAAVQLREAGYEVINPADVSLVCGCVPGVHTWEEYLARDLATMLSSGVQGLALLPGWESSRGAKLEIHLATALSWPIMLVKQWLENPELRRAELGSRAPAPCAG